MASTMTIPTPATIATQHGLAIQRAAAAADATHRANARRRGYKGPMTRVELAAEAHRKARLG